MSSIRSMVRVSRALAIGSTLAVTLLAGIAALPAASQDGGVTTALAPERAEAFQAGFSGDRGWHFWMKTTRGEVVRGVVAVVCARYMRGPLSRFRSYCTSFSRTAQRIVGGRSGFWLEVWPWTYRYGTY